MRLSPTFADWCSQGAGDRPTATNAMRDSFSPNAGSLAPLFNRALNPIVFKQMVASFVSMLLYVGSPPAIVRTVSLCVVDAINGAFRGWLKTHVGKEVLKAVLPAITHRNSGPSVAGIIGGTRIVASVSNVNPCAIFGRAGASMSCVGFAGHFTLKTSATAGYSTPKIAGAEHFLVSTIAPAKPSTRPDIINHHKSAKAATSNIVRSTVDRTINHD